ncbi:MAG: hypothetical protein ABIT05_01445 [Chitinophagaceae bacterium]
MKKVILIASVIVLGSFTGIAIEKSLTVQAPVSEWQKHINKLEVIRKIADESNMGNQEVKFITKTIDSLEMLIVPQLRSQIDTTKKK